VPSSALMPIPEAVAHTVRSGCRYRSPAPPATPDTSRHSPALASPPSAPHCPRRLFNASHSRAVALIHLILGELTSHSHVRPAPFANTGGPKVSLHGGGNFSDVSHALSSSPIPYLTLSLSASPQLTHHRNAPSKKRAHRGAGRTGARCRAGAAVPALPCGWPSAT
jgi:hypothetical protein